MVGSANLLFLAGSFEVESSLPSHAIADCQSADCRWCHTGVLSSAEYIVPHFGEAFFFFFWSLRIFRLRSEAFWSQPTTRLPEHPDLFILVGSCTDACYTTDLLRYCKVNARTRVNTVIPILGTKSIAQSRLT